MEAEIIALGSCCRELLPIIALVDEIGVALDIRNPMMTITVRALCT